jgi:hypothetical protein
VPSRIDQPVGDEIWTCAYQRIEDVLDAKIKESSEENTIRELDVIVALENGLEIITHPRIKGTCELFKVLD